ncbi:hypothetical protein HIM_01004 [Hirsutella minnesotensis 3608]|nr:hypothetical protein HIM_01004 [Hirsutella minnesotensis 3608]
MASCTGTDSDNSSELTTLVSGDTPTLPGQEQPSIRALFEAQDDAAYDLAVAQIPRDHRVRVKGICGDYHEYTTPIRQSGSYVQLATTVKRAPFEEALIAFFVVCQIALRLVADELFVGFLRIVYPSIDKLLPGCGNTLRALVLEAFNKRKEHLKEVLARSVSKIHFSFDLWTSPNHLALLGVVAHFIDEFGQNQSLHGSHSGENQAEVIKEVIQEYNLQNRIGYFVTDNASNNNTAIDSLIARFLPHLTPKQRLGRRLRCLGHVINLSAKAFLYGTEFDAFEKNAEAFKEQSSLLKELHLWRKRGPVGKLHNIVTFICRTPQRREKFANIQSQSEDFATEFDGLKLVVDNATRWNSLYLMIERAIKLRDRIDRFCIDHAEFMHGSSNKKALSMEEQESLLKHDSLTADDWAVLTEIVAFLEKFYTLTKRAEGSKLSSDRGVLSDYLTTLNVLLKHAREYRDDINFRAENPDLTSPGIRQLRVCIVNCWTKLDEYFALVNDTPAHYAAIVTNPQMKWKYFERQWKDAHLWKDATLPESWLPGGKRALNSLWEEYKNLPVADACAGSKRARTPDEFERETDMTQWDEDEMDELETWLSMKVFKLDDDDTLPAYWLRQSKQPATQRIAKMGLDMASIPAMSSDLFAKCIMRSEYSYLKLQDLRHIRTSKEMGQALVAGMLKAFNGGDIEPSVFVFPPKQPGRPGPMVWNQQFLAFAGYRQPDGSVLGDPMSVSLTEAIIELGWEPPSIRTRWDLLPLVTMADGDEPYITPFPESLFPLVQIRHPKSQYSLPFEKLGLRWVPPPALSQLGFDIGGVQYTATPFMGWFMDAEIGVRNLADSFRYNVLPFVVDALDLLQPGQELDELPQWERLAMLSRAQAELNYAVHWSFSEAGVRMSDSLTASAMYANFDDQHLAEHGFRLPADPYWLAPPQGSIVPVWHRGGAPNYQPKPMICRLKENPIKLWKRCKAKKDDALPKMNGSGLKGINGINGLMFNDINDDMLRLMNGANCKEIEGVNGHLAMNGVSIVDAEGYPPDALDIRNDQTSRPIIRVFYCSSGTTAQRLAVKLEQRLRIIMDRPNDFDSIQAAAPLNNFQLDDVSNGDLVFIVASSAGRGDVPTNGHALLQRCKSSAKIKATEASICIFGNGNSSYGDNFNGAALKLESALEKLGFISAMPIFQADTLKEDPPWRDFKTWLTNLEAKYGSDTECSEDTAVDFVDDSTGLLLSQLSTAKVLSIYTPKEGDIKRLALDIGDVEYGHMSHVDVFVPLQQSQVDELLLEVRLSGNEMLTFEQGKVSTRQLLSLVDPSKPFKSLKWAAKLELNLTGDEERKLLRDPISVSIQNLPVGWQSRAKRGNLADFILALPTRRPRTFSTASSQLYWTTQDMGNVLELTLQTHAGGLVTDSFLSRAMRGDRIFIRVRHGPGGHLVNDDRPLIAFTTGSGIAPLRGLLQARSVIAADEFLRSKMLEARLKNPVSLFLGLKPGDVDIINETVRESMSLGVIDMMHLTPSNPEKNRAQDKIFQSRVASQIRTKIRDMGASVFVCASKEAADDFARNLEAIVGVPSIREALGERWVEEVYVYAEG